MVTVTFPEDSSSEKYHIYGNSSIHSDGMLSVRDLGEYGGAYFCTFMLGSIQKEIFSCLPWLPHFVIG